MPPPLCETCQGQRKEKCALIDYRNRVLATVKAAQADFAATPGPQDGNEGLIAKLQSVTDVDFASLPAEADRRGCTIFSA